MSDNRDDEKPNKVGYKKPPVHSRWRKGKSGNPSGQRKKFVLLDMGKIVHDVFLRKVPVREGRKVRRQPKIAALVEQKLNESFNDSNGRLFTAVMRLAHEFQIFKFVEKHEVDLSRLTPEEREVLREAGALYIKAMRKD
jgi:hypothetical protein